MEQKHNIAARKEKEGTIYTLLFFFVFSFLLKVIFGSITGSQALLVSGIFAFFGIFICAITLLRIHDFSIHSHGGKKSFSYGKLEFFIVSGVSLIIVISIGAILFSIVHMIFFHTLYPAGLIAAWVSAALGMANWYFGNKLKKKVPAIMEADFVRIKFLLNKDFILSILVIMAVIISRSGFIAIDYILAILEAVFIMGYGIYFLNNSFKGLMDASCSKETVSMVKKCINKAEKNLTIQSLRVNPVGKALEIITVIGLSKRVQMSDVKKLIGKIKQTLKADLSVPYEVYVGFSSRKSQPDEREKY